MLSKPKRGTYVNGGDVPVKESNGVRIPMEEKLLGKQKPVKINKLRYAEYYGQQEIQDKLYEKSSNGEKFDKLMGLITSDANIIMAYRSIKRNKGSNTPGTDGLTIKDIEKLKPEEVCNKVRNILKNYNPRSVRRKDIPKPNGKTRPLGIPCIWDRLIQQCILQILEPICEAKFFEGSFGFRPLRSTENAINEVYRYINRSNLYYMVEIDIKGFFDHVNHSKLMRQIWAMGIQDKQLLCIIKKILKAQILLPNGEIITPTEGTPQGGIISPLLANIVLNEFDWHMESQWGENPLAYKWKGGVAKNGTFSKGSSFREMRKTNLKELHVIRYADDIRIMCSNKADAMKVMQGAKNWLNKRLKLQVSDEKTVVRNLTKQYGEFLGIKFRTKKKSHKQVIVSHMCDKAVERTIKAIRNQIKEIQRAGNEHNVFQEIGNYNALVRGVHNYYQMATDITEDCQIIHNATYKALHNRLHPKLGAIAPNQGDYVKYGKCKRIFKYHERTLLPISYCSHRQTLGKKKAVNLYTAEGRAYRHKELCFSNAYLQQSIARNPVPNRSIEYNDNRVSLFSGQRGKCAVTGREFLDITDIHCHHKTPRRYGGKDNYMNLVLVLPEVHRLIHATNESLIAQYIEIMQLNVEQITKLNKFRIMANLAPVEVA